VHPHAKTEDESRPISDAALDVLHARVKPSAQRPSTTYSKYKYQAPSTSKYQAHPTSTTYPRPTTKRSAQRLTQKSLTQPHPDAQPNW